MDEKVEAWSILIALACVAAGAYLLAWRGKRSANRRGASVVLATLSALAGCIAFGYAVPALGDLHNPAVPFGEAVIGNLIMWGDLHRRMGRDSAIRDFCFAKTSF